MFRAFINLLRFAIHAAATFVACVVKEKRSELLDIKGFERRGAQTLFQTHENSFLEWNLYAASVQTISMNSEFGFRFFTAEERRAYIVCHFGARSRNIRAYDMLRDGAYKSDIFRLCVLFIEGGIYMDCKSATIVPFKRIIPRDSEFAMFIDTFDSRLSNGFIFATQQSKLIKELMDEALRRVLAREYGKNHLDIAGPEMFGTVVKQLLGIRRLVPGRYVYNGANVDLLGTSRLFDSFMCIGGKPVIKRQPDNYFFNLRRFLKRYEFSWISRTSFIDS